MSNSDKKNNNNKQRVVKSDSRNNSGSGSSSRRKADQSLDFDYKNTGKQKTRTVYKADSKAGQKDQKTVSEQKGKKASGRRSAASKRSGTVRKGASKPVKSASRKKSTAAAKSAPKSSVAPAAKNTRPSKTQKTQKNTSKRSTKTKKTRKPRNKFLWFMRSLIITLISLVILGCIAGGAYAAYIVSNAEPIHPETIYDNLPVTSHIYDDQGVLIDDIYYNENREITTYGELPEDLKNAFIAVEDKTFWTHRGFNFRRIFGAILERFRGGRISGTSTITQQLARNVFLPEEKSTRSIKRKITEMYYAYEIEESLSKEEILTAYLNTIYLGYGCYGVDTAAKVYFSRSLDDLSLEQCAALAALPQAPGSYALLVTEEGEDTTKIRDGLYANDMSQSRRDLVLQLMQDQGYITAKERKKATKPLSDFIDPGTTSGVASTSAFKDYLIDTVKHDLIEQYEMTEDQAINIIFTKGLHIYSTLDSQAQEVITDQFKIKENFPSVVREDVTPEAAMVVTEIGTGKIKAMVGTRNAGGQMLFNRATNPRQPGSSIKPLTVYAAALQKSLEYQQKGRKFKYTNTGYDKQGVKKWGDYITVSSYVKDEKMKVKGKTWPLNVTRKYSGNNTFRTALQKSINTCAVKILAQVGIEYSMDMLHDFGITTAVDDTSEPYNDLNLAALGLGAMTEGVSPLEMSLAYAAFPNGGVRNTGICYTKVVDGSGEVILEGKSEEYRVMDEGVAWIMTDVLQSVVTDGIASPAAISGEKVGGKTGTTDSRYDIWFDGFTATYSCSLWIGTDNNVQMDAYGEKAAEAWSTIVSRIDRAYGGTYRSMPENVIKAWDGEYYTKGTEPAKPKKKKNKRKKNSKTSNIDTDIESDSISVGQITDDDEADEYDEDDSDAADADENDSGSDDKSDDNG